MTKRVIAVSADGVLRLLEPVDLPEHQRLRVTLHTSAEDELDTDIMDRCAAERKRREQEDGRRMLATGLDSRVEPEEN